MSQALILQRLTDAQTAYHQLLTGGMARVVVDKDGSRVEFTSANRDNLAAYISKLQSQVCPPDACSGIGGGPVGFLF